MTRDEIVVGLDIGTTKVGTVIASGEASAQGAGSLAIIGVGIVPSRGIKRGVIVDVEETVNAIRDSVERAAHMAGVKVEGAVAGITGDHIQSFNQRGTVTVASRSGTISRFDVERVLQAAALEIPRDREIIHSLPRDFAVDGHAGVKRPIGMAGQRLEVETHIVTGRASFLQNAVQCAEKAGIKLEALVLEPIATAEAVTTADERDMGVVLIDIGGGTSDLAVFVDGSIVYTGVLPVGGNHVTRDIAIGLRTAFELAEQLKIDSGAATREIIPHGEALEVTVAGSGERLRIPRSLLGEIIEARMSELFELAREMLDTAGVQKRLPGGMILAGGGSLLPGAVDLCSEIFQMPVRLGLPRDIIGWSEQVASPQLATGVGLCRFALKQRYAPGNQTEIPAIASSEGRRIWGAIAPLPVAKSAVAPPAPEAKMETKVPEVAPASEAPRVDSPLTSVNVSPDSNENSVVDETQNATNSFPGESASTNSVAVPESIQNNGQSPAPDAQAAPLVVREEFGTNTYTASEESGTLISSESPDAARSRAGDWPWKREPERVDLFRRDELEEPAEPAGNVFTRLWASIKTFLGFDEK